MPFWNVQHSGPLFRMQLEMNFDDGTHLQVISNSLWQSRPSWIKILGEWCYFNFGGEFYDAAQEIPNWHSNENDSSLWINAKEVDGISLKTVSAMVQPNRIVERLQPVAMKNYEGALLIDFGKACTGTLQIKLPERDVERHIIIEYADAIRRKNKHIDFNNALPSDEFNHFNQKSEYSYGTQGRAVFENKFNYASFRYVKISNLHEVPKKENIVANLITTDLPYAGSFRCGNEVYNAIHNTVQHTLRCLMLGGYQVDCHSRERLGYGGDGQSSLESTLMMFKADAFYKKWLNDWLDAQRENGDFPHTAPCPHWAGGGPLWSAFPLVAAWQNYLMYGEKALLQKTYEPAKRFIAYLEANCKDGLLKPLQKVNYRNWYLADWATPNGVDQKHQASVDLFNNCYFVFLLEHIIKIANALGDSAYASFCKKKIDLLKKNIHSAFYDSKNKCYADGDQIDYVMPLMVGAVPENLYDELFAKFQNKLLKEDKGHLTTGLSGTYMMIKFLHSIGRNDLINIFASKTSYPSWGYMIRQGATSIWEYWDGKRSCIHNCYNSIGSWFYKGLAGINPSESAPAFKEIIIAPCFFRNVRWVEASFESIRGTVEINWQLEGNQVKLMVNVPTSTIAAIFLPLPSTKLITQESLKSKGIETISQKANGVLINTLAGRYSFLFKLR